MRTLLIIACVIATFLAPAAAPAQDTLTIGMGHFDKDKSRMPVLEALFTEVYKRAGLKAEFVYASNVRDVMDANTGALDATMGSSLMVAALYPNLVPLSVPMAKTKIAAMKNDIFIWADSWKNLRPLRLVTVEGDHTSQMLAQQRGIPITVVGGYDQAFKMVDTARMDAVLCNTTMGSVMARKLGYTKMEFREVLHDDYAFHLLNKKHAHLVPALSEAWRTMLEDGTAHRLAGPFAPALPDPAEQAAWPRPMGGQ